MQATMKPTWKRLVVVGLGVALLLGGGCLAFHGWTSQDPMSVAFAQVKEGMATEEAMAILGKPSGTTGLQVQANQGETPGITTDYWISERSIVTISSREGKVVSMEYGELSNSFAKRFLRRIGLR